MRPHLNVVRAEPMENPLSLRLRALTSLDESDLAAIAGCVETTRHLRARAEFMPADTRESERIHVVLDGWACRFRLLADGRRQITAVLMPGDICDLSALYVRNSGFALATLTACTIASLNAGQLRELATERPQVARTLGWLSAVDASMLAERNASLGRRSAREHMAHLLCELTLRSSVVGLADNLAFALRLTQDEIADVLGLTAVHVNRVIQGLRAEGLIEQRGQMLAVRDWEGLRQAAGFRADYLHLDGVDGNAGNPNVAPWSLARTPTTRFAGF